MDASTGVSGLLCKSREEYGTDCEFFGSRQWGGYCSKCVKQFQVKLPGESEQQPAPSQSLVSRPNLALKKLINRLDRPTEEIHMLGDQFKLKIKSLKFGSQGNSLYKECEQLVERCSRHQFESLEEVTQSMRTFYDRLDCAVSGRSVDDAEEVVQLFEDYLSSRVHSLFFTMSPDLEAADKSLHLRITNLWWVKPEQLASPLTPLHLADPNINDLLDQAMSSLMLMDARTTVRQKLQCIDQCMEVLNQALHAAVSRPVSADDLFPTLVYIVLQCKPPQLHSNINFIDSVAHPAHLTFGHSAYNFNNFHVAVQNIAHQMNAASLNVPSAEFEKLMRGEKTRRFVIADILKALEEDRARLSDIKSSHEELSKSMKELSTNILNFRTRLRAETDSVKPSSLGLKETTSSELKPGCLSLPDLLGDLNLSGPSVDDLMELGQPASMTASLAPTLVPTRPSN